MLTRARIPWNTNQLPTDGCAFQRINDLYRHVPVCGAPLVRGWARDRNWGLHGKFKELLLFSPHLLPPSPATSTVQAAASHQPPLLKAGWLSPGLVACVTRPQREASLWSKTMGALHKLHFECLQTTREQSPCPPWELCSYRISRAFWQENVNTNPRVKMP